VTTTHPVREELGTGLAAALSRQWQQTVAVEDVRRLSGGASMETWSALAVTSQGTRPIILRRDRPGAPQSSRLDEAALLRLVRAAGVPVPEVLAEGEGDDVGTAYLVMEFLHGETIPRKLLRDEEFSAARGRLVAQVGQALAAIHTVPAAEVAFLGPLLTPEQLVGALTDVLVRLGCASPVFELAVRWLLANLPVMVDPTLVHGDVRNGNLMVDAAGLSSVLDWELAHPGQPAEDLGWFCVRAWRFGQDDKPAGGFGTRKELLEAYRQAGGRSVSPEDLRFWEVFGTLKWGATCLSQVAIHLRGDARSVELAAIGRRVAEVEYDLVLLMEESA
jgi:aminoglycoside phosphotransferase (APT) family kinase protein